MKVWWDFEFLGLFFSGWFSGKFVIFEGKIVEKIVIFCVQVWCF